MTFVFVATGTTGYVAGGDVLAIELARRLLHDGHRIVLLTSREGRRAWERAGVYPEFCIVSTRAYRADGVIGDTVHLMRRLLAGIKYGSRLQLHEPAVVFSTSEMLNDVIPGMFVRGPHVRRLAFFHMVDPSPLRGYQHAFTQRCSMINLEPRAMMNYFQQRIAMLVLRLRYNLVITHTSFNRKFISRWLHQRQVFPYDIPYGIDRNAIRSAMVGSGSENAACWIGRWHPQKGIPDLVRIWKLVQRERPDAHLAIVGDVANQMRHLVRGMELGESIKWLGYLEGEEKFRVLSHSNLLLFPSYFEGKPVVIAEALACGVPVVAYDLPVYHDSYSAGLLTAPIGDIRTMARQVLRLLGDGELHARLSTEARAASAVFDWDLSAQYLLRAATLAFRPAGHPMGG